MEPRVLSIQSHVVAGYVGNRSAVFPLQLLGFEVDFINSVQFSNHTWYKVFKGQVLNADDLETLFSGLRENGLDKYTHVLTGYIGDVSFLNKVCDIVKELKQKNPDLIYVCDPVMGDEGNWYVPKDLLPVYQEKVLPLADIVLPNQWEAEQLTGQSITNQSEALKVMQTLHTRGPHTVALTSTNLAENENQLLGYASTKKADGYECVCGSMTKIPAMFIGTGDLFAALFLAWLYRHPGDVKKVLSIVQSTMSAVLETTYKMAQESAGPGNKPSWAEVELKLIQSKSVIEQGPETVEVKYV